MRYIIAGNTMVNDILFADGSKKQGVIGGGVYCIGGIKPFEDSIGYVTAAGNDFEEFYDPFFRENALSKEGVKRSLPNTQYNLLQYKPDGRWEERSIYGRNFKEENTENARLYADDLKVFSSSDTVGIYSESRLVERFWEPGEIAKIRNAAPNAKIMWEIPTEDITRPERRGQVLDTARLSDIFSLNLPEGKMLFGVDSESEVIEKLLAVEIPCFFRVGERGSYMLMDGEATFAPSVGVELSVDPTGCGNCSTATALYGFAEGWNPLHIAVAANVTAGYNAKQFGPYPRFSEEDKEKIEENILKMVSRLEEE